MCSMRYFFAVSLALLVTAIHAAGATGLLNDTGQHLCFEGTSAAVVGADAGGNQRQDARFGTYADGTAEASAGAAGFHFTKVCMSGELAGIRCRRSPSPPTNC